HGLDNGYSPCIVYGGVAIYFGAGSSYVLCSRTVSRTVVSTVKVVVYRLRYSHNPAFIILGHQIFGNLIAGIHRVIAAVIEKIPDIILFKNLKKAPVISIILFGILEFITAGTQSRRRSTF